MSAKVTKAVKPETQSQAETWTRVETNAALFGLDHRCAAQLAWGAQLGFANVHEPCDDCKALLADQPTVRPGGWRTPAGTLSLRSTWGLAPARPGSESSED
jgi:hypothetical protein